MRASMLGLVGLVQLAVGTATAAEPARDGAVGIPTVPIAAHPSAAPMATDDASPARRTSRGTLAQMRAMRTRENTGLVGMISGWFDDTDLRIANDLAAVLDAPGMRVLPLAGKGSVQNVTDIVFTRGVDVGIVQADVLQEMKRDPPFPGVERYLRYITKLYDKEIHILAPKEIRSVEDLSFKKVNIGVQGSGTFLTAHAVLEALGIIVEPTMYDPPLALELLKRGQIAALVFVVGKPAPAFQGLGPTDNLHLVPVPDAGDLGETYAPATLSASDYPGLVDPEQPVKTLSVGAFLVAYNWPTGTERGRNVARFVDALFRDRSELAVPGRHPKWREIDPTAPAAGWQRYGPPDAAAPAGQVRSGGQPHVRLEPGDRTALGDREALFRDFMAYKDADHRAVSGAAPLDAGQRDALFREFLAWSKGDSARVQVAAAPGSPASP